MNTTMAPMDQIRQGTLEELRRRHDSVHQLREREDRKGDGGNRRDGGSSGGGSNDNGDGDGNGGSGGKGGGNGDGNNNPNKGNDNSGNKKANNTPENPPSKPTQDPAPTPSATTVIVVSTTTAPAPAALTTSLTSTTPTETFISSFFPTTTSFSADPIFTIPTSADTSSQPRKGLNTDGDQPFSTTTTSKTPKSKPTVTVTSAAVAQTALGSASTTLAIPKLADSGGDHHKKTDSLSPLAEQLLIAAGAIGAFIMIAAGIYFLTKMMKIDLLSKFRNREFSRGGRRGWFGWRKKGMDYASGPPPSYPGEGYPPDEKSIPAQRQLEAFYSPMARPPLATPAGAAALSNADPQRQETVRAALIDNPASFGFSPVAETVTLSATQNFYNISQDTNLSRKPSTQASQVSALSQQNTTLSRQPGTQVSLLSQANSNYNNTGTQNTFLTRQTSDAYDPNQREVNHLSYLSSLSSGFGDGLILPESTVNGGTPQAGYRQSRSQGAARFSWVTSVRDRDTVYTQASIESAPRYRTVNSWVAQQSSRVERQQQSDAEVPAMPAIPLPLQVGVDHQRKTSEDPAFKAHPGDEITISRGSRVPSEILDKTIGLK